MFVRTRGRNGEICYEKITRENKVQDCVELYKYLAVLEILSFSSCEKQTEYLDWSGLYAFFL